MSVLRSAMKAHSAFEVCGHESTEEIKGRGRSHRMGVTLYHIYSMAPEGSRRAKDFRQSQIAGSVVAKTKNGTLV